MPTSRSPATPPTCANRCRWTCRPGPRCARMSTAARRCRCSATTTSRSTHPSRPQSIRRDGACLPPGIGSACGVEGAAPRACRLQREAEMKSVAMRVAVLAAMLGSCVGAVQARDKAPPPIGMLPTDKVVEMLDRNGNGCVDLEEGRNYTSRRFHLLDKNADGSLDATEAPP